MVRPKQIFQLSDSKSIFPCDFFMYETFFKILLLLTIVQSSGLMAMLKVCNFNHLKKERG